MRDDDDQLDTEASDFMAANRRTFMVTLRKDGSPTAHPMAGFFGGRLYLNAYGKSAKARNLERDDRICCVVTNPSDAESFQAALYRGRARPLTVDEVFAERVTDGLAWARNPRSEGSQDQPDIPPEDERKIGQTAGRISRGARTIFEVSPDEVGMLADVREV